MPDISRPYRKQANGLTRNGRVICLSRLHILILHPFLRLHISGIITLFFLSLYCGVLHSFVFSTGFGGNAGPNTPGS
jgi:hypothetical protein